MRRALSRRQGLLDDDANNNNNNYMHKRSPSPHLRREQSMIGGLPTPTMNNSRSGVYTPSLKDVMLTMEPRRRERRRCCGLFAAKVAMPPLERLTLSTFQKWRLYNRVPVKFLLSCLTVLLTSMLVNEMNTAEAPFRREAHDMWHFVLTPAAGRFPLDCSTMFSLYVRGRSPLVMFQRVECANNCSPFLCVNSALLSLLLHRSRRPRSTFFSLCITTRAIFTIDCS
jgi:hypothetical protein